MSFPLLPCPGCGAPVLTAFHPPTGVTLTLDPRILVFQLSDSQVTPVALAPAPETFAAHVCPPKKPAVQGALL